MSKSVIQSLFCAAALLAAAPLAAQASGTQADAAAGADVGAPLRIGAVQIFELAQSAIERGDLDFAESAYRALIQDPDLEIRTEARFRLAKLYSERMERPRDAAVLLRRILDDKPDAAAVRIELARLQANLGNYAAAERELRAVQAGDVPPQVQQLVRFYAGALASGKPSGGSIEIAIAPSSNINRATSRTTLDTIIGDFTLDQNARARSGVGASLRAQAYRRFPLGNSARLLARLSADGDFYRERAFTDIAGAIQIGPEWRSGRDRLSLAAAVSHRWFGYEPYLFNYGLTGSWRHPLSDRMRLRLDASGLREDNAVNALQTGNRWALSGGIDAALSAREGAGVSLFTNRFAARDPGYSTWSGGAGIYSYREIGRITAAIDASYSRLEADRRLFLYPERRRDHRLSASLSATLRQLRVLSFAPLVRAKWERTFSSVGIFDFQRISGEFGIVSAF